MSKNIKTMEEKMMLLYPEIALTDQADSLLNLLTGRTKRVSQKDSSVKEC